MTEAQRAILPQRPDDLTARVRIAATAAAAAATAVDTQARFPSEAFAELRRQRLLALLVPASLGGEGLELGAIADICYTLGQACSSTALIFAMHQVKMGCIVRHAGGSAVIAEILRRAVSEQLLFASSTTEGQRGGNLRSSEAALERTDGEIGLERRATVISYAADADGIVTTARRGADAAGHDQVLVVLLKADYALERSQGWDTLGMRGTRSEGFTLRARAHQDQVLPQPYERIHAQTMVPFAHLLWGSVWAGIAAVATGKTQAFIRHAMRHSNGQLPPAADLLTEAISSLRELRGVLAAALHSYERVKDDERQLASLDFQSMITLLKVQASELACETVATCLRACGLAGYRNDGEFSMGRYLRDVLSAPLMINNQRILSNVATSSLMTPLPMSLHG